MDHLNVLGHRIIYQDSVSDIERYTRRAREEGRVKVRDDLTLIIEGARTVAGQINKGVQGQGQGGMTVHDYMNQREAAPIL